MSRVLPVLFNTDMVLAILDGRKTVTRRIVKQHGEKRTYSPYNPGDILYVRETWSEWTDGYVYKAWTSPFPQPGRYPDKFMKWHPSIHMPKEAARIWLRVTDVRVERLQDMTGQDILKEGVNCHVHPEAHYFDGNQKMMFAELWDSTVKKTDLDHYGWDADPWVWVIEFERCKKPEEE